MGYLSVFMYIGRISDEQMILELRAKLMPQTVEIIDLQTILLSSVSSLSSHCFS